MENLHAYTRQQDSDEEAIDLGSRRQRWKSDEKYKTALRHQFSNLQLLPKVKDPNLSLKEGQLKHKVCKDIPTSLYEAVKEYLQGEYDSDKLNTVDAILKSRKYDANALRPQNREILGVFCRIKPPEHAKMDVQVDRLLDIFFINGIDLNDIIKNGETFLMLACENRRIDIVRCLLKLASHRFALDMDVVDKSGETALMKAEKNNDSEMVVALLGFKLISAVKDGNEDIVKSMIDVVYNVSDIFVESWCLESRRFYRKEEKRNKFDIWADAMGVITENVIEHHDAILKLLLDRDVLSSIESEIGWPLLQGLIRYRCTYICNDNILSLIEMLLKSGKIYVNARDVDGRTALHLARHEKLASLLIRYGADVNKKDNSGKTTLMMARVCDYEVSVLRTILDEAEAWVDLDATDCNGRTALMIWTMMEVPDAVELLLNAGASVNLSDHLGFTALHHALYGNMTRNEEFPRNSEELKTREEMTTILFNEEKPYGHFHLYRERKDWNVWIMKIVQMLLRRSDVDVNALSFEKFSPLDMSERRIPRIPPSIENALKEKGAALSVFRHADSQSTSDFHLDVRCRLTLQRIVCEAATENDKDFLKGRLLTLIETFQEQLAISKDRQGRTALHLFAISLSLISPGEVSSLNYNYRRDLAREIVRKLISLGCNVNEVDIYGHTALHYADEILHDLLISEGADAIVKYKDGNRTIDRMSGITSIILRELYNQNAETLCLCLLNNTKLEINVQCCESQDRRLSAKLNPKDVPEILWKDGEYAFRHPLVKQIAKEVMNLMDVIAREIERLDPRFAIRPVLVGSSNEGTKLDKPDQFDFYFVLTKISEICEVSQSPELPTGFVRIKRKLRKVDETKENDFDGLFEKDGILNTAKLDCQFRTILMNTVVYIESQQSFYFNLAIRDSEIKAHSICFKDCCDVTQKVSKIKMFIPLNFSSVNIISIDIVPCIHVDGWWPDEAISNVSEDIKMFGCNLVFESPLRQYPWVPYSDSCARISFAKAESDMIKQSCDKAKEAYIIGKIVIKKTQWDLNVPFNYTLKHCLLYCIEALTPTTEKASKLGLSLEELETKFYQMDRQMWLRCLMECYLDFVAQDFCPCYFLPNFSSSNGKEYYGQREYLKHLSCSWMRDVNEGFLELCRKAGMFYCCTSNDISESYCELSDPDPLWERFDREDLIAHLCEIAYKSFATLP